MILALKDLLQTLFEAKVDFVLAGGLAAVAQGAPVTTFDVDIAHRRTEVNVDKLLGVLSHLHAYVYEPANRRLSPSRLALLGAGHNLFVTDLGSLDCRGAIENGFDYNTLLPHCVDLDLNGRTLRVVRLAMLAELKGSWSDDESKLRAAILRRTLNEK